MIEINIKISMNNPSETDIDKLFEMLTKGLNYKGESYGEAEDEHGKTYK